MRDSDLLFLFSLYGLFISLNTEELKSYKCKESDIKLIDKFL